MHERNAADAIVLSAFALAAVKVSTSRGRRNREVEQLQSRLTEVEERLDFAERLLTSREQADQLPEGAHR